MVVDAVSGRPAAEAVRGLLDRRVAFTAILCVNDFLALDALGALAHAGKRVPEDVSVAGMGGLLAHPLPEKTLTTVIDDYRGIGRAAGELLLRRIESARTGGAAQAQRAERRVFPAQLRAGETTGPPPRVTTGAVGPSVST
jgi:DNA-binding LacI/PurR family transcriptional regulator